MKIYVAVVHKAWQRSGRPKGDWASFIDKNKKNAIKAALDAREEWERKGYGPYRIWVGVLTQELSMPVKYELVDITEKKPAAVVGFDRALGVQRRHFEDLPPYMRN